MEMVWCYATSSMYQNDTGSMYTKSTSILCNNFCLFNTHKNDQIKSTALYELSSIYSMVKGSPSIFVWGALIVLTSYIETLVLLHCTHGPHMLTAICSHYKSFSQPALLIDKYRKNKDLTVYTIIRMVRYQHYRLHWLAAYARQD
ncbi:uncharacterized protein EV154DRAFT_553793 [Mucor mucedo]|uniref:uncharacterized protein n=1 Tax=Mucor mucedo TaxID=29922 RepID=UPI00221E3BE4|nr:uncharacterized protein EV154DRAFT_553793 [Mucor mucedo]KAI7888445.1 hypothetical protein EV154DRAFT_553793 [Mucor mucedo]